MDKRNCNFSIGLLAGVVPPFQGLDSSRDGGTQGVALGCHVTRFQRGTDAPKAPDVTGAPKALDKIAQGNALGVVP